MPDPFVLTESMRAWGAARYPDVDLDATTAPWLDLMRARGDARADWEAAWRREIGNAVRYGRAIQLREAAADALAGWLARQQRPEREDRDNG